MKILLISDNLRVARFIQRGFEFEHLFTSLENSQNLFQKDLDFNLTYFKYKAIMIYSEDQPLIKKLILQIQTLNVQPLIIIMSDQYLPDINAFADNSNTIFIYNKPFHFRSIAAEIKFHIFKLSERKEQSILMARDIKMNLETREVFYKGESVFLRNKEFALLQFLILNQGKLLSRVTILENVWDLNADLFTNTVDVHISKLRKILKISGNEPSYIKTVTCLGYIFC